MRDYDKIIMNTTVTNETKYSDGFPVEDMNGYALQAAWAGALANGQIKIEASIDNFTFFELPDSAVTISGPGDQMWNVTGVFYKWVRMCVISTDVNTITMVVRIYAKGALP